MSLDDPNVMAGIAADGQPFFSDPAHAHNQGQSQPPPGQEGSVSSLIGGDMDTPMPMKRSSGLLQIQPLGLEGTSASRTPGALPLATPAREADAREMREFWKQYMRTPLSGPTPAAGLGDAQASNASSLTKVGTPYRRPRVASLPSAKTPIVELEQMYGAPSRVNNLQTKHRAGDDEAAGTLGPMSSMRTTLHGNQEDLRSYEAAVMARRPPTALNLQPKKLGKAKGPHNFGARPRSAVDVAGSMNTGSGSRPLAASSLANAFGASSQGPVHQASSPSAPAGRVTFSVKKEDRGSVSANASPAHSRASSGTGAGAAADDELSTGGSPAPDQDSGRPSFKRLPSQTLGPENSKRAFYGFDDEEEDIKDRELMGWGTDPAAAGVTITDRATNPSTNAKFGGLAAMSHSDRVVASLSEKRRRRGMSAPNASLNLPPQSLQDQGLEEQKMSEPYGTANVPGMAYAPAAQGLGN
ncbi:hypothetical protein GALMADRAFT_213287 [Galerina marginata CBS 339.88]|uniref:Uncharacterized protein n=1 Tax=Galerina marginata (strain CBS 339.88) TaxID=685588 RepID=A0A067SMT5_GALM3|nr:hypothetical protein GALMADRAFT_213287 [Galerina marginata CBS 339.88]